MQRLFDLTGKSALVAGGGGYLGRPICQALAAHGAKVMVADLREDAARDAADAIAQDGGAAKACQLDAGDTASIDAALRHTEQAHGPVDVLVNCTFYNTGKPHDQLTADEFHAGLRVTLTGAFELSRAAAGPMLENGGGSIIHFGSMYGVVSPQPAMYDENMPPNPPDYGAAKAGVLQLTRYQAVLWGPRGVRVNAVVPGPFTNPKIQGQNPAFIERQQQRVPMGRLGRAPEIAPAVVYLASDDAGYVTGTALTVDGGWTAW